MHNNVDHLMFPDAAQKYRTLIHKTVKGHINWMFRRAHRPFTFWHRSYLVTGRPKDGPIFQLDQQCYPFLELCDFLKEFPEETAFAKDLLEDATTSRIIETIELKRNPEKGLYPTNETPGDDPVEYPFHFSSHVLLWYTFARMSQLTEATGIKSTYDASRLHSLAENVRLATLRSFVTIEPYAKQPIFAYLTNGDGQHTLYHDANDIPTLLAPVWNFVHSTHELKLWSNTMQFGLSSQNGKGYCTGKPFGGLGSVHTPGPWPLGYFQEFLFAQMTENLVAEKDAWRRIRAAMLWDGLFSEAVDYRTAECTSRAWFSWPGSMIGSALLRSNKSKGYFS